MHYYKQTILLSAAAATLALAGSLNAQVPNNVPKEYADLYSSLQTSLTSFTQSIPTGAKFPTLYASQLLSVSSENIDNILRVNAIDSAKQEMTALEALGVQAVTFHINFPVLYAPFYEDQTQYQQILNFYQSVVSEARGRGLKVIIETQVAKPGLYAENKDASEYIQALSWNDYINGRAQNAANIAQYLRPDYLVGITEPDTEGSMSGHREAAGLRGSVQMLGAILTAVRGVAVGVPVGAGVGTWQQSYDSFLKSYAAAGADFLDLHIYPVNRDFLKRALTAADIARQAGKPITLSEAWLHKQRDSELANPDPSTYLQRNVYSFWAPLDTKFLQAMNALANYKGFTFVSPGYSCYYYAYLNTTSPTATESQAMQAAGAALAVGSFTSTGLAYENLILPAPDKTAPAVPPAPAIYKANIGVSLSWNATTDNVGVAGYRIYKNGSLIGTTSLTTFKDNSGRVGSTDSYTLTAFDAVGNSSPRSVVVKTPVH